MEKSLLHSGWNLKPHHRQNCAKPRAAAACAALRRSLLGCMLSLLSESTACPRARLQQKLTTGHATSLSKPPLKDSFNVKADRLFVKTLFALFFKAGFALFRCFSLFFSLFQHTFFSRSRTVAWWYRDDSPPIPGPN